MQEHNLTLATSPFPFSNYRDIKSIEHGYDIETMLTKHFHADVCAYADLRVFVNGNYIPRSQWAETVPLPAQVVNVRAVPQGGGGGKSPLATVLGIVVSLAAPGIGTAFGTSLGLSVLGNGVLTAGQTAFFNSLVSTAFGALANLAISAIAKPPKPKSAAGAFNNAAESPTLFIEGARNEVDRYGPVGLNLGTNRVFPKQAALPYTTNNGDLQEVRQIFCYGHADECEISDIRIGETPISQFTGVTMEHRLSGNLNDGTNIYSNDVFQDGFNTLVSNSGGFVTRTSQPNVDELIIDFTFDRGLAEFNSSGERIAREVVLDAQYAPTGTTDWSSGYTSYKSYSQQDFALPVWRGYGNTGEKRYRSVIIYLDIASGVATLLNNTQTFAESQLSSITYPELPAGKTLLARATVQQETTTPPSVAYTVYSLEDARDPVLFGDIFQTSSDFAVTDLGGSSGLRVAAGALKFKGLRFFEAKTNPFKRSITFQVPNGQYDVRVQRISADSTSDQILDTVYFSALKSVTYQQPVTADNVCGTAMVIQASEQLNGAVDQFNVIMSTVIPDYDADVDAWIERTTSNPASLYRYILQGSCNSDPLSDSQVNIADLEAWHVYCENKGYTYNYFIDYETSIADLLRDIASAGAASPTIVDGKYTVVVDRDKDTIVQMITPQNSWGYKGSLIYEETPHAFRVNFRNASNGYRTDEVIVYDDGYTASNATRFETLDYPTITNSDMAWKMGRRYLASIRLRPETHRFYMDVENLVATRGDRIVFVNDVPLVGVGSGRILTVTDNGTNVTSITIDNAVTFESSSYSVRIRLQDGTYLLKSLTTSAGETTTLTFATPFALAGAPDVGDLCSVFETGEELDLIITEIRPSGDLTAEITAIDYAPAIFTAETGTIPQFTSKLTLPSQLRRPDAPVLDSVKSDESVMIRNSDGSYQSRMVIKLVNPNDNDITPVIFYKQAGTDTYDAPDIISLANDKIVITGLQDGYYYDFKIMYRRANGVYSLPLLMNNTQYEGASALPANVTGFLISETNGIAEFSWSANDDIDLSHYIIKYSNQYSGATWEAAQVLANNVTNNSITKPFLGGTYLIKAVDILGNESAAATSIITFNPGDIRNVVETITESPGFNGTKDNCILGGDGLEMLSTASDGLYYFANSVNLGNVAPAFISSSITANARFTNNIYDIDDIFAVTDIFGGSSNNIYDIADIFAVDDIFGIGANAWAVKLEYRTTQDDPTGSPTWSAWQELVVGTKEFWGIEFRLRFISYVANVTPTVSALSVTVDMPDRIVKAEDVTCPVGGLTVDYGTDHGGDFQAAPSVNITIQNSATDDRIEYTVKNKTGFTVKIYNATAATYVERILDYTVIGYGKVI